MSKKYALPSLYNCESGDVGINVCRVQREVELKSTQNKSQEILTAGMSGDKCGEGEGIQQAI